MRQNRFCFMKLADIELPAEEIYKCVKRICRGDGQVITYRASLTPGQTV